MGGIFDEGQVVPVGNSGDGVEVGGETGNVYRDDGFGARGDGRFDEGRVNIERVRLNIHKNRAGIKIADHLGGGGKGVWRGDHLIAGLQAGGVQGQVHRRRAGVDGHPVFSSHGSGKVRLKATGLGAGGDPAGADGFGTASISVRPVSGRAKGRKVERVRIIRSFCMLYSDLGSLVFPV